MHKCLLMIAGLLSLVGGDQWLQHRRSSVVPADGYLPVLDAGERSPAVLYEKLFPYKYRGLRGDKPERLSEQLFKNPPATAKPWACWHWGQAGISPAEITASLEAMQAAGIGGAYLVRSCDTVGGSLSPSPVQPVSPAWWEGVRFALQEAQRLNLQLGLQVSDEVAGAGSNAIIPEQAMQKLVWSKEYVRGGELIELTLPEPAIDENYYKDIAVLAYRANCAQAFSDTVLIPRVTSSIPGAKVQFLAFDNGGKESFRSDSPCWIQYKYPQPFTCRSIRVRMGSTSYQPHSLLVQVSNDGYDFTTVAKLEPPRYGWQDAGEEVTHAIPAVSAPYFRFVYDKISSVPGREHPGAAKGQASLQVSGLYLSDEPALHQYESKHVASWQGGTPTNAQQAPDSICVPLQGIVDLTGYTDAAGKLAWQAPAGNWIIVRIGHTPVVQTHTAGEAGKGLPCDLFNPVAVKQQFYQWLSEMEQAVGAELAKRVMKSIHVDGRAYSSQNWSPVLRDAFRKRCGYDLVPYLLAMTGTPVQDAATSEAFLYDVRQTIAALIADHFYATLAKLAHDKGIQFSVGNPAAGAPVYGKRIVHASGFTAPGAALPGSLKAWGDRFYTPGPNKLVLHAWQPGAGMENKAGAQPSAAGSMPGNTLYWQRCQALLQLGAPVADIAVLAGEEGPYPAQEKDLLNGYGYDVINADVLLRMATVKNKRIVLPGGISYGVLVMPGSNTLDTGTTYLRAEVGQKIRQLVEEGATVLMQQTPAGSPSLKDRLDKRELTGVWVAPGFLKGAKGRLLVGGYNDSLLARLGLGRDVAIVDGSGRFVTDMAWTHRKGKGFDIYFISNQSDSARSVQVSLRITGKQPELWDPLEGSISKAGDWQIAQGRTLVSVSLPAYGSVFLVFRKATTQQQGQPVAYR